MTDTKPIRRIAIVGTGVIGASWTSLFLAKGLQVVATDIAPNAEARARKFVECLAGRLLDTVLSPLTCIEHQVHGGVRKGRRPVPARSWARAMIPPKRHSSPDALFARRDHASSTESGQHERSCRRQRR